ncbi:hypothetical protein R1flu_007728 [Riccia fluitans]|uniref:Uncharacterized protein n=1 Tax=Riccia fluitans TaxID=41844 RepID=A0ABD1Z2C2_9MARC
MTKTVPTSSNEDLDTFWPFRFWTFLRMSRSADMDDLLQHRYGEQLAALLHEFWNRLIMVKLRCQAEKVLRRMNN